MVKSGVEQHKPNQTK